MRLLGKGAMVQMLVGIEMGMGMGEVIVMVMVLVSVLGTVLRWWTGFWEQKGLELWCFNFRHF